MATHRDPSNFQFNDTELEVIKKHLEDNNARLVDMEENLATDRVRVPSQNYALISIVSSNNTSQRSDHTCVKIRGVFETIDEANRHASKIINHDPTFDVMVVSMYEWLMVPPDMEKIKYQQYMDESLNTLISEYRVQQERSRQEFDVRRDGLKQNTHTVLS